MWMFGVEEKDQRENCPGSTKMVREVKYLFVLGKATYTCFFSREAFLMETRNTSQPVFLQPVMDWAHLGA